MINKIVYTYWTNKGVDFKLGFLNKEIMLHVFNKSIEQSKKLVNKVVVYCDKEGYEFLKDKLQVEFYVVDYSFYEFDTRYWNFPKLITYNLQNEPFLHVDIDALVYDFDKTASIVSECRRGVLFDRGIYPSNEDKKDLLSNFNGWLTCSGILGGINIIVFKKLFKEVEETVKNKDNYTIFPITRMIIEEVVISCLIKKYNLKVKYLNKEKGDYIHYWGEDKLQNFITYNNK